MILYGLKTCDTCRKARRALEEAGHAVRLRDVRAEPLDAEEIAAFLAAFGERIVNRSSATYRALSEEAHAAPPAEQLAAHPALMKRPVLRDGDRLLLGWGADVRAALLGDG